MFPFGYVRTKVEFKRQIKIFILVSPFREIKGNKKNQNFFLKFLDFTLFLIYKTTQNKDFFDRIQTAFTTPFPSFCFVDEQKKKRKHLYIFFSHSSSTSKTLRMIK